MKDEVICPECQRPMDWLRKLSFDEGRDTYDMYRCPVCVTVRTIHSDKPALLDEGEMARVTLDVVRILQTMSVDEIREVIADLESKTRKPH